MNKIVCAALLHPKLEESRTVYTLPSSARGRAADKTEEKRSVCRCGSQVSDWHESGCEHLRQLDIELSDIDELRRTGQFIK